MNKTLIQDTLISLGMSANLRGFNYIVDAIYLLDKPEWKQAKFTSLYNAVGALNNTSSTSVESGIRKALKIIRANNANHSKVEYYLGYCNCDNGSSLMQLFTRLKATEKSNTIQYDKLLMKQVLREMFEA